MSGTTIDWDQVASKQKKGSGVDWDSTANPPETPHAEFDPRDIPPPPEGFVQNLTSGLGVGHTNQEVKEGFMKGLPQLIKHPIESAKMMYKNADEAQRATQQRASEAWGRVQNDKPWSKEGIRDFGEASIRGVEGLIPLIGPMMEHAGEQLASGDVRGGAGSTLAIAGPLMAGSPEAGELIRGAPGAVGRGLVKGINKGAETAAPLIRSATNRVATAAKPLAPALKALSQSIDPDLVSVVSPRLGAAQKVLGKTGRALDRVSTGKPVPVDEPEGQIIQPPRVDIKGQLPPGPTILPEPVPPETSSVATPKTNIVRGPGGRMTKQFLTGAAEPGEKATPPSKVERPFMGPGTDVPGNKPLIQESKQTIGTAEGAKADTEFFARAKQELGDKVSLSDIAKRAQELKDQAGPEPPPEEPPPSGGNKFPLQKERSDASKENYLREKGLISSPSGQSSELSFHGPKRPTLNDILQHRPDLSPENVFKSGPSGQGSVHTIIEPQEDSGLQDLKNRFTELGQGFKKDVLGINPPGSIPLGVEKGGLETSAPMGWSDFMDKMNSFGVIKGGAENRPLPSIIKDLPNPEALKRKFQNPTIGSPQQLIEDLKYSDKLMNPKPLINTEPLTKNAESPIIKNAKEKPTMLPTDVITDKYDIESPSEIKVFEIGSDDDELPEISGLESIKSKGKLLESVKGHNGAKFLERFNDPGFYGQAYKQGYETFMGMDEEGEPTETVYFVKTKKE